MKPLQKSRIKIVGAFAAALVALCCVGPLLIQAVL